MVTRGAAYRIRMARRRSVGLSPITRAYLVAMCGAFRAAMIDHEACKRAILESTPEFQRIKWGRD